jgi:hypothetical protein
MSLTDAGAHDLDGLLGLDLLCPELVLVADVPAAAFLALRPLRNSPGIVNAASHPVQRQTDGPSSCRPLSSRYLVGTQVERAGHGNESLHGVPQA